MSSLSNSCGLCCAVFLSVVGRSVLLRGGHSPPRAPVSSGGVFGLRQRLSGWVHVKWTSGCVTRWRLSFTSVITGYNVLADQCPCLSPPSVSIAAIMIVTDEPQCSLSSYKETYKKIQTITLSVSKLAPAGRYLQIALLPQKAKLNKKGTVGVWQLNVSE